MPEINLLQNRKKPSRMSLGQSSESSSKVLPAAILVLLVLASYGGFMYLKKQVQASVLSVESESAELDAVISAKQEDIDKSVDAQSRLKLFEGLLQNHIHWTKVWSELGSQTYRTANYFTVEAAAETNKLNLTGYAPSYSDLGKLLLGLEKSEYFESIELQSASTAEQDKPGVGFEVLIVVKPEILYGSVSE